MRLSGNISLEVQVKKDFQESTIQYLYIAKQTDTNYQFLRKNHIIATLSHISSKA